MPNIVELRDVAKAYRFAWALKGVSLDLREGEVYGYIGPNGAGKTTTLKILAGLLTKFTGSATVDGRALPKQHRHVHQLIGYLPQSPGFQNWRSTESVLYSLGELSGVARNDLDRRVPEWLERFDLTAKRDVRVKKLSGGMVQKLAFIQAILHEPKLIILDEPLAGLDPVSRNLVKEVIRECKSRGATVLFSSHILSDVQDVADSVGILHSGKLLTTDSIDALKAEMPTLVALDFSAAPADLSFLDNPEVESIRESSADTRTLRLRDGADADAVIHHLIERTLAGGGRIRRVGRVEPNLDELYARYIAEAQAEAPATPESGGAA